MVVAIGDVPRGRRTLLNGASGASGAAPAPASPPPPPRVATVDRLVIGGTAAPLDALRQFVGGAPEVAHSRGWARKQEAAAQW